MSRIPRFAWRLACLGMLLAWPVAALAQSFSDGILVDSDAEVASQQQIRQALAATYLSADLREVPLNQALAFISAQTGVPLVVDYKALNEGAVTLDDPCKAFVPSMRGDAALKFVLSQHELAWYPSGGVAVVTTTIITDTRFITRVYPVRDLVLPANWRQPDYQSLINAITQIVAPTTWADVGGQGGILPVHTTMSLVVSQTYEVHEQIAELLAALRKARKLADPSVADPHASPPANAPLPQTRIPAQIERVYLNAPVTSVLARE